MVDEQVMTAQDDVARFADVPVELEARLSGPAVRVGELLALDAGFVIPLGRSAGDNADVLAGGAPFASGEILVIDEAMAIRITDFAI